MFCLVVCAYVFALEAALIIATWLCNVLQVPVIPARHVALEHCWNVRLGDYRNSFDISDHEELLRFVHG